MNFFLLLLFNETGPGRKKFYASRPATGPFRPHSREERRMFANDLLQGQRILVTGGGTGLGQAMAERFLAWAPTSPSAAGARPCATRPRRPGANGFPQRRIDTFGVDIRVAQAVEEMVEALWQGGGLTGLVNNAAGNFIAPTESLSPRAFDAIANIVFHGTFYVTQAVGKRWVAQARAANGRPAIPSAA
jgi:NAD(P)-dependent dehydrogenase (short-subunit alcohol dehydrogenase family)